MGRTLRVVVVALLALVTASAGLAVDPAPGLGVEMERVLVMLHPGPGDPGEVARGLVVPLGGSVGFVYRHALRGFSAQLPTGAVTALRRHPQVALVEPDRVVTAFAQTMPTGIDRIEADRNPMSGGMVKDTHPYTGEAITRANVDIAILDTGVDGTHPDLRLRGYTDCTSAIFYPTFGGCSPDGNPWDEDRNGHGTHVAGIAAAIDNDQGVVGVAPGAHLWSVKVLGDDGTGYLGSIVAGIDAVTAEAHTIEVANMSLGGEFSSELLDTAIANSVSAGVVYVVAAGNSGSDASTFSPASHPDVITVSALADFDGLPGGLGSPTCRDDQDDTSADFSNFGPPVDIAAPGVCILSTWLGGEYRELSGTSMASPYVAGAVARYIAERGIDPQDRQDVEAIRAAVLGDGLAQDSECGFSGDTDGLPEPLLFVNGDAFGGDGSCRESTETPPEPENQAPTAGFTFSCNDLTCSFTDTSTDTDGIISTWTWSFGDGRSSTEQHPTHTYSTAGDYTVTLTVTDDDGDTGVSQQVVTVTAPPEPEPTPSAVHVADLDASSSSQGRTWTATVRIQVVDDTGGAVSGATVSGSWSNGASGSATCTTDATGWCAVSKGSIRKNVGSVTFSVTGITHGDLTYDSGANTDPDGDSDGTRITVTKP